MKTRGAILGLTCIFALLEFADAVPARAADLRFRGLIDVVGAERGTGFDHNLLTRNDSNFDAYSLRAFAEATANDQISIFTQFILRDATTPYVNGAYVMYTPSQFHDFHVLAGKIPWLIGTYAPRTYSIENPVIGSPLMYQYHSTVLWYEVIPSADALLSTKGQGQYGVNYFGYPQGMGMPLVDDCYWDVGITATGSINALEMAIGVNAGTPGWGSTSQDENTGKSLLGRVGFVPLPGLRFGVSGAYGPYLIEPLNPQMPAGKNVNDYNQQLAMADLELTAGHFEIRAEGAYNVWETPTVGDLKVTSAYAEAKYSFPIGAYVAGRFDALRFGEIADSGGIKHTWDADVTRIEGGVGYRFDRNVVVKVIHQHTTVELTGGDKKMPLTAASLSVAF
jgi:hypothetical protein